jgi:thiol-disulfide isomerase/thioredoxin
MRERNEVENTSFSLPPLTPYLSPSTPFLTFYNTEFYATWCKSCALLYPKVCGLAKDKDMQKRFKFVKVRKNKERKNLRVTPASFTLWGCVPLSSFSSSFFRYYASCSPACHCFRVRITD